MKRFEGFSDFTATNPAEEFKNNDDFDETCGDASQDGFDGSVTVKKSNGYIHCLTIIGQIEGHYALPPNSKSTKYEHIIPLKRIPI